MTKGVRAVVVAALGLSAVRANGADAGAADSGIDPAKSAIEWTPWPFRDPRGGVGSAKWERVKDRKAVHPVPCWGRRWLERRRPLCR